MTEIQSTPPEQQSDLKNHTLKAGEILLQGHKRYDRVFENEGSKIMSIHCDTLELCILKNDKSSIWEKLCLCCSPVSVSLFICIISTKEFNGESAYWAGFMTSLTVVFAIVGICCGIAWYQVNKSKKSIFDAIRENCIGFSATIKENSNINNINPTEKTTKPTINQEENQ